MARDSGGTHTLPAGNPVVDGTTITASWGNTTLSDLSTEITDSLSRSGKGGMTAALKVANGAVGTPSYTFTNDSGMGLYRSASGEISVAAGGSAVAKWTVAGWFASLVQSVTAVTLRLMGRMADGASAVGVALDTDTTYSNATAKLLSVRNNTTEKLAVDKDGAILGPAAGSAVIVRGTDADDANGVGVILDNSVALTTTGGRVVSFRNANVEKAYVTKDGAIVAGAAQTTTGTAGTNWTISTESIRRNAGVVTVDIQMTASGAGSSVIYTIPAGYRPTVDHYFFARLTDNSSGLVYPILLIAQTAGTILVDTYDNGTSLVVSGTAPLSNFAASDVIIASVTYTI